MRAAGRTGLGVFGLSLATAVALTVPDHALGASRSIGRPAERPGATRMHRRHPVAPPLQRSGIITVGGESEPQIIIIQPAAPAPVASERTEPAGNKTYVPSRWVDGGYGVQVLVPGYWVEPKQAAKR